MTGESRIWLEFRLGWGTSNRKSATSDEVGREAGFGLRTVSEASESIHCISDATGTEHKGT